MFKFTLLTAAVAALVAPALATDEWIDDFAAAKAMAQEKDQLMLVDFTGSDWCGWCIKLRKEVLDTPEFDAYAKDKFVLMEVDCPHKKKLDVMLAQQNQKLCQQYKISGFPTILVLNPEGEVVGGFGGYKKMDGVKAALDKAIKTAADIKAAKQLPADKQEAALATVYQSMDKSVRQAGGYEVKGEAEAATQRAELKEKLSACTDEAEMMKILEAVEPNILPQNKAYFLDRKFTVMVNSAQTVEELAAARKVGDELINALPAPYAAHIKAQIERDFADPEALLKRIHGSDEK